MEIEGTLLNKESELDESKKGDIKPDKDEDNANIKRNTINFTSKETYYFRMISGFFKKTDEANIEKMLDIIEGKSKISLRLLDWFVTRYAKKHKIGYNIDVIEKDNTSENKLQLIEEDDSDTINVNRYFPVHISYKAQLKSYKKRYFDPFRRRKKFYYKYDRDDPKKALYTTIGQLNFFSWAFENKVIEYVEKNYDKINNAMIESNKEDKKRKQECVKQNKEKTVVKQHGINVEAEKKVKNDEVKITVSFY